MSALDTPLVSMQQQEPPWETQPYLDRIWHADQLHWQERAMLMEMHKAGALNEGDLHMATLRSLSSSGLHAEGMRAVLQRFWDRFAYAEGQAACSAEAKNSALQELLREQVTPPRRAAWRSSRYRAVGRPLGPDAHPLRWLVAVAARPHARCCRVSEPAGTSRGVAEPFLKAVLSAAPLVGCGTCTPPALPRAMPPTARR
jgi:hypothetical protein